VLLLLAALAFGVLGGIAVWRSEAVPDPPLTVDPISRDLGEVATGSHEVTFHVTNPAGQHRRVIGLDEG
jgi:hypothetical protein